MNYNIKLQKRDISAWNMLILFMSRENEKITNN